MAEKQGNNGNQYVNDTEELKPRTFRIAQSTAEKFAEISKTIGGNQQQAMTKLIEAYELQYNKVHLPEFSESIEQFERYSSILVRMFLDVVEDRSNNTKLVRTEYETQLRTMTDTIADLQKRTHEAEKKALDAIQEMKDVKSEAKAKENDLISRTVKLREEMKKNEDDYAREREKTEGSIRDKDALIRSLGFQYEEEKSKMEKLERDLSEKEALEEQIKEMKEKLLAMEEKNAASEKELAEVKKECNKMLEDQKRANELEMDHLKKTAEIEKERALMELEKKLNAQANKELETLREKYMALTQEVMERQRK